MNEVDGNSSMSLSIVLLAYFSRLSRQELLWPLGVNLIYNGILTVIIKGDGITGFLPITVNKTCAGPRAYVLLSNAFDGQGTIALRIVSSGCEIVVTIDCAREIIVIGYTINKTDSGTLVQQTVEQSYFFTLSYTLTFYECQ